MGYFQVKYDSRVIIYDRIAFIRLTTGLLLCTCFRVYDLLPLLARPIVLEMTITYYFRLHSPLFRYAWFDP